MNGHNKLALALLALSLGAYATEATAAAVRINACMTITKPGLHVLTKNIDVPAGGDCLIVDQEFVTIDFRGFAIRGGGTGAGVTDGGTGRQGITIRDGTVTNFLNGIELSQSIGVFVERMRVIDNLGVGITSGRRSIVTGNVVLGNSITGISTDLGSLITKNVAEDNGGDGISTGNGSIIADNIVVSNGNDGIRTSPGSTVTGNTARGNGDDGIEANCPSNIIGNTVTLSGVMDLNLIGAGCVTAQNIP